MNADPDDLVSRAGAQQERLDKRGTYARSAETGKGIRQPWAQGAREHLASIGTTFMTADHCSDPMLFSELKCCPRHKQCKKFVSLIDVLACHSWTYGDPEVDAENNPTAKNWPSIGNHAARARWFEKLWECKVDNTFIFKIGQARVCASFWRAAYNVPRSTFEEIARAVHRGDVTFKADEAAARAVRQMSAGADAMTAVSVAMGWWVDRLMCYDFMPNERGVIVADVATWSSVYEQEYLVECEMLGVPAGARATWYDGRDRALTVLAHEAYGADAPPFKLRMRAKNRTFKECPKCQQLRLAYADALKSRDAVALRAAKAAMKEHSQWFLAQRAELDRLRRMGTREDTLFEQSDACGEDCLNLPSFPRVNGANASLYVYKIKLQANLYPGSNFSFLLTPPHLTTGRNFGFPTMLLAICSCIKIGRVTKKTRTYVHSTDGGSENRSKLMHALNYLLVSFGVFDQVLWVRLPPNHSHDFVDRVFSAIEKWMDDASHAGCFNPWDLRDYLYKRFASESSAYHELRILIDILVANFDFVQWLYACMDESRLVIKEVRHDDGSVSRPEPLVWRYEWDPSQDQPIVNYKMTMHSRPTFDQSEWGPWRETYLDYEDPASGMVSKRRVLRTDPAGVDFMLKLPDVRVDPGYEEFLAAGDWSMTKVFADMGKVVYPPSAPSNTKDVWKTLASWHAQHERSGDVNVVPVPFSEPHMAGKVMGAHMLSWHEMWATLLRFSPRKPLHGPLTSGSAAPSASTSTDAQLPVRPIAQPIPAAGPPAPAPRAHAVNVVNHRGYTVAEAAVQRMCGEDGEQFLRDNIGKPSSLVWVELGIGVFEGELRVGLAAISARPPIGERAARDGTEVWVEWFTRKSSKREWGKSSVAFKSCFSTDGGRKVRLMSLEQVSDLLPVVVEVIASSADGAPSVSKRSKEALISHISEHRPNLMVAAAAEDRSSAQHTKTRRRSGRRGSSGSSSDEEDDEDDEDSSSSTKIDSGSSESGSGGGGHDNNEGGADGEGGDEGQGEGGDEDDGSSDDPLERAFERATASRREREREATQPQPRQRRLPTPPLRIVREPLDSSDDEHGTAAVFMQQEQIKQRRAQSAAAAEAKRAATREDRLANKRSRTAPAPEGRAAAGGGGKNRRSARGGPRSSRRE